MRLNQLGDEEMARIRRDPKKLELAKALVEQYNPKSVDDIDDAIKDLLSSTMEDMLDAEMNDHLGYEKHSSESKENDNRRNGYTNKTVKSTRGSVDVSTPRDRDGSFDPKIVGKRQTDISGVEEKIIAMYAKGMSTRDISDTIDDIYGFDVSAAMISDITDKVIPRMQEWQTRPLKPCYAFLFVDCLYVSVKHNHVSKKMAVYTILGYDLNGKKDILGIWMAESESKHFWLQIFDEIKARGVEDIFFVSMDGVSGLEAGVESVFPQTVVQRCIVHLIRNSVKYIPSKHQRAFCGDMKPIYNALSIEQAQSLFSEVCENWSNYPGALAVWERNFEHVEQLMNYGQNIRRMMYTTNAVESIHKGYRKVTKKGTFPSEISLQKILYLRTLDMSKKWINGHVNGWSMVLNELMIHPTFENRLKQYIE